MGPRAVKQLVREQPREAQNAAIDFFHSVGNGFRNMVGSLPLFGAISGM